MALPIIMVNGAYNPILGRPAEGEAYTWASNLASHKDVAQAVLNEVGKDNAAFVENLYLDLLNRPADFGGLMNYTMLLNTGLDRVH